MKRSPILIMTKQEGTGKLHPQARQTLDPNDLVEKVCPKHQVLGYAHKNDPEKVFCGECFADSFVHAVQHGKEGLSVPCFTCGNHKPIMVWADDQYFCSDCCPEKK